MVLGVGICIQWLAYALIFGVTCQKNPSTVFRMQKATREPQIKTWLRLEEKCNKTCGNLSKDEFRKTAGHVETWKNAENFASHV